MKSLFILFFVLLLLLAKQMLAQDTLPVCFSSRILQPPEIDGELNDESWKNLATVTRMVQYSPVQGIAPSQKTEVRFAYDDFAIYIAARMYDTSPDSILRELGNRDDYTLNADVVKIGFDPYNTRQDCYIFEVTASGVQRENKNSDPTFDAVWESAVTIDSLGWCAEIRIPYSALRFPSTPEQTWGFQVGRTVERCAEYDQWAVVPRGCANVLAYWGKMKGISNINAPARLSLTPFLSAVYDKSPEWSSANTYTYNKSLSYNYGADLKYGIDDRFTLDVTLLPDFSQVQSDARIKNLGYQEVVYTENRQFFKEGTELFNKNEMFYSRRIGKTPSGFYSVFNDVKEGETLEENPSQVTLLNAAKISGRNNNGLGIGFFNAITNNMYAVIKDSSGNRRRLLTEPLTNYNIIVFDQQLRHNSNIYLINTNVIRTKKGNDANVTGSGGTFFTKNNKFAIDFFGIVSQKYSADDSLENMFQNTMGYRYFLGARKASGRFQYGLSHSIINKSYDSRDLGYNVIGDVMKERIYLALNFFKPNKLFLESYNSLTFNYWTNPSSGKPIYITGALDLYATLHNFTGVSFHGEVHPGITYDYLEPRVPGKYSRNWKLSYYYLSLATNTRSPLGLEFTANYGKFIDEPRHGDGYGMNPMIRYRASNRLLVKFGGQHYNDTYNLGFADIEPDGTVIYGGRHLRTWIINAEVRFMFKNDMSLNLVGRHYWNNGTYLDYYTLLENGEVELNDQYTGKNDFSYNAFNIDLVYSWQFAPGSILSVAYKNAIEKDAPLTTMNFKKNMDDTFASPQQNTISVKFLYYLDYHYAKKWFVG